MNITVTGRKVTVKETFKQMIEKELLRVERFFGEEADAWVTVTVEKDRQTVEITIRNGGMVYRAEQTSSRMEDSLDKAVDDLIRKIRKNKTRIEKRLRQGSFEPVTDWEEPVYEETALNIVKAKKIPIKPISPEEAVLEMNLVGHSFFMFRNEKTGEINVVYRRRNGDYGLIEPEE